jgi:hypothetical protein
MVALIAATCARFFAVFRLRRGDRRFEGLLLLPTVVLAFAAVWASVLVATRVPLIGVPMLIATLLVLGVWMRATVRLVRSGRSTPGGTDPAAPLLGVLVEPAAVWGLLVLGGGILAVVGLLIWGLTQNAPR